MKQYKAPQKSNPTRPQPTPHPAVNPSAVNPAERQQIDAGIQKIADLIQKDPKKAAKIFEAWLDSKGQSKKNIQKKRAA